MARGRRAPAGTYRAALANRALRAALASYALASAAQGAWTVALAVALYDRTGSPAWAAVAACTRLVPYILFSPVAGVLADRWGHRRTLEIATTARILLAIIVTAGIAMEAPPLALAAVAFLATVAATPVYPALNAFVPAAVPASELAAANSLLSTIETVGWIVGPAIGGLLVATTSASVTAAVATATLVLAFAVLTRMPRVPAADRDTDPAPHESLLTEMADGIRIFRRAGAALSVLLLILATNLIDGSAQVLLLLVADEQLGLGDGGYGLLTAVAGIGAFGAVLVNRRLAAGPRPLVPLLTAVAVGGVGYALLGTTETTPVAIALLVLVAGSCVVVEVVSVTILQRSVPVDRLARVFGLLDALMVSAIVVGATLAPVLNELLGLTMAMVVTGAVVPGVLAVLAPLVWRAGRRAEAGAAALRPLVDALAALPLLRHAPEPVLMSLALGGRRVLVRTNEVILRQGAASDDVFLVLAGSFIVLEADGDLPARQVNRRATGDCFGEIGPLRGVARTASVVADDDGELLRIPGQAFVAAVNNNAFGAGGSAVAGIVGRVASSAATTDDPDHGAGPPG